VIAKIFFSETWYGGVMYIVSKIATLITFGSVCRRDLSQSEP